MRQQLIKSENERCYAEAVAICRYLCKGKVNGWSFGVKSERAAEILNDVSSIVQPMSEESNELPRTGQAQH